MKRVSGGPKTYHHFMERGDHILIDLWVWLSLVLGSEAGSPLMSTKRGMEKRRNDCAGRGGGDPRENPPTSGIGPARSPHAKNQGVARRGIGHGSQWWEASRLTARPPRSLTCMYRLFTGGRRVVMLRLLGMRLVTRLLLLVCSLSIVSLLFLGRCGLNLESDVLDPGTDRPEAGVTIPPTNPTRHPRREACPKPIRPEAILLARASDQRGRPGQIMFGMGRDGQRKQPDEKDWALPATLLRTVRTKTCQCKACSIRPFSPDAFRKTHRNETHGESRGTEDHERVDGESTDGKGSNSIGSQLAKYGMVSGVVWTSRTLIKGLQRLTDLVFILFPKPAAAVPSAWKRLEEGGVGVGAGVESGRGEGWGSLIITFDKIPGRAIIGYSPQVPDLVALRIC
ncbi:hypothetical protein PR048_007812 [Dryococelus australis]|uniref:Uncharacterized protein n=1 Tax=Dryococelus australis TaxID=614101 RepID=A0ABQ9HW83_9NEOP|nr:hypothetical protein PR048_007812 [Dryococelus australis]